MIARALFRTGTAAALAIALLLLASGLQGDHAGGRISVESSGAVAGPLVRTADSVPDRAATRLLLAESAQGTYIAEILAERDSALARWPDRGDSPLTVWIQPVSAIAGWSESYVNQVRDAFVQWDTLHLPVRFVFTRDSVAADIHVTFINQFDEEISGRTTWARDDSWCITDADIVLAVFHHNGPRLDDEAMRAMSMHEVGHLLGLDHTRDDTSIMAPRVRVRALSAADRATVRLLYALPPGGVR